MRPQTEGNRGLSITVVLKKTETGHELSGNVRHGRDLLEYRAIFDVIPEESWKLMTVLNSTHPHFRYLQLNADVVKQENGVVSLDVNAVTPWKAVQDLQATASYL